MKMIVGGAARPNSHITRVVLRSGSDERALPFAHGYYIGSLEGSTDVGELPATSGPFTILAYDRKGALVTTLDLAKLLNEASP